MQKRVNRQVRGRGMAKNDPLSRRPRELMQHFRAGRFGILVAYQLTRRDGQARSNKQQSGGTLILYRRGFVFAILGVPPNLSPGFHAYVRSIHVGAACKRHANSFATAPCRPIYRPVCQRKGFH